MAQPLRLPRRILMTADAVGGVWSYALDLATELGKKDVATVLAVMGPISAQHREQAAAIPSLTLEAASFKLEWMAGAQADLEGAGAWLLDLARIHQPDLIHLNSYAPALLPWEAPTVLVAHSCLATWWRSVHGSAPGPEWSAYLDRVRDALAVADMVVAPSRAMLNDLAVVYGKSNLANTRAIHNGRDLGRFPASPAKEPFVLCAGRLWDLGKGIGALNKAAAGLDWPVYAAGPLSGPDDGLEIEFPGLIHLGSLPATDLAEWMRHAAVFCSPSLYEPFGLAVLEAAMSGAALVLSDIPTFRELWDGAAVFVPPADTECLRHTLRQLIGQQDRIAELGRAARVRSFEYTLARSVRGYAELYSELLTRDTQPVLAHAAG